jgi:hypothetical protein
MAVQEVLTSADIAQPVADRLLDLVMAPLRHPELIWILFPMLTGLILMTIYFGRYKDEELGWNTAVGNSMILIFVAIDLFKKIYGVDSNPWDVIQILWNLIYYDIGMTDQMFITTLMAVIVFLWGLFLVISEFFHILPQKLAFMISSSLPINLFAYTSIVVVYSTMAGEALIFSWATVVAALILFFALWVVFSFIQWLEPKKRINDWKTRE